MWGLTLQFVCTEKAEKTLEKQFVVERCFISIFYKAKTICCGSDQSQLGAASQSWKTLGKVGFGWVKTLLSNTSVVNDSRLRLSAIFAAVVDTRGR